MSNDFYNHNDGVPATLTRGASTTIRSEFDLVQAGFDKLPSSAQMYGASGNYATAAGPADAWTASIAPTYITALADGMQVRVKFPAANATTTPTINLNALGAKTIVTEDGSALATGNIGVNMIATLTYNSSSGKFHMTDMAVQSATAAAASAVAAAASAAAAAGSASAASGSATAAAASRAAVLYIIPGAFAPGTPPTVRGDGSAVQAGDYAFFTDNLFRRYNGSTWVASDVNTANLAASSGSSLVGFIQAGTGAAARTSQDKMRDIVSVFDFMTAAQIADVQAGTLTLAIDTAVANAIASFPTTFASSFYSPAGTLYFPPGKYKFSSSLHLRRMVKLLGATSHGQSYAGATEFVFPPDTDGVVWESLAAAGPLTGSDNAILENVTVRATGSGTTRYGLHLHAQGIARNVRVTNFGGGGVRVSASVTGVTADTFGNSNLFRLENVAAVSNGGDGFHFVGSDANAGTIIGCDSTGNTGYGFYEESSLGNTFVGTHASSNGNKNYYVPASATGNRSTFIGVYDEAGPYLNYLGNFSCIVIGGLQASGWDPASLGMMLREGKLQRVAAANTNFLAIGTATPIDETGTTCGGFVVYAKLGYTSARYGLGFQSTDTNSNRAQVFANVAGSEVGNIIVNAAGTVYNTVSDHRLKQDVQPMVGALAKLALLKPVTYTWKTSGEPGQGFIAHELQEVFPDAVSGVKDAVHENGTPLYQGVDASLLVGPMVAMLQELAAKVASLEAYVAAHP